MYFRAFFRCREIRSQNVSKVITCLLIKWRLLLLRQSVLSVRFEEVVSLLLAPAGADKRGPKAPFLLRENAGIQPAIHKRVPAGAPAGARSYWKHWTIELTFTEVSNERFLSRNNNKALCSAATLAVLDALDVIASRCQRPKLRDLKSAMEEVMEIWTASLRKKPCFWKREYQGNDMAAWCRKMLE